MTKNSSSPTLQTLIILFMVSTTLFLSACGTLEIDVEHTSTPGGTIAPTTVALATEDTAPAITKAAPAPTRIPTVNELRVVFVKNTEHGNNVWLWTEGEGEAAPLTKDGGVADVKISDDSEIVAFTRGDGLWMVKSDSSDERQLVSADEFAVMESREAGFEIALNRFDWVPGTHILAFNTRLRTEIGLILNDDLHLVNADTLERTGLLPPGEGGEFQYSPDGRQVAVVTPGTISLMNTDGGNRREVFTYTPVSTRSEVRFYAKPVWAADSGSLRVAIPPVDPFAELSPQVSIWNIHADGRPAGMIGNIGTGQMGIESSVIAPNLRYIAYLYHEQSDPTSFPMSSLLITDLDNNQTITYYPQADSGTEVTLDGGETATQYSEATLVYGWSPDSQHLAFLANLPDLGPRAQIGQLGGDVVPVYDDADAIIDVHWVDANRYLFSAQNPRGWDIMLGKIGGPVKSVAFVIGSSPIYDFTTPPYDSSSPAVGTLPPSNDTPTLDNSGDSPIPFGLIYQTIDGLWYVNADGEPALILEHTGTNHPAISPNGAQILYDEANDIWLADITTGERRNLTQTPDRFECCAQWWPGQSEIILFNSSPEQEDRGPNYGFSTVARLDGSDYAVLDDSGVSFALPAPSPDGQTVAYDQAAQPWLYRSDTGPEPFDLTPYNLPSASELRVVSPSWSPDGTKLAWLVAGDFAELGGWRINISVFDLETRTTSFLYTYEPAGRGGWPLAPAWSPDGQWLTFIAWAWDSDELGMRIVRADGQEEEYHLGQCYTPVWSPDGRWLACTSTPQGLGSGVWLVEVGTWDLYSLDLPSDVSLVDWVDPLGN